MNKCKKIYAILHIMWNSRVRANMWKTLRLLNKDVQAQVNTNYVLTRNITFDDTIGQGGALSVT
jgi:hypothetical protein